ncbi:MAG: 6-phosphofructokinase [Bacteroidales bacterium]|nr:6-phosphofructokinase [Bacteroidales bacterium]
MNYMKKIAVFTSGGDAPGMNAAIRAVVRAGIYNNVEVVGIMRGYAGMVEGSFKPLVSKDVSNIIQHGGTILKTARSKEFMKASGRKKAYDNLVKEGIEGVVAIGGNGTFTGANIFENEYNIPFVGIPGTIDNDLYGTDYCIGYDTAINTVMQALDKIRDTASAHNRLFFVEVMGRDAGFLALRSGISGGAEGVLIPEVPTHLDELHLYLENKFKEKKSSGIIVVAEGEEEGGAYRIAKKVRKDFEDYDVRVTVLGHVQRGGSPTAFDRVSASKMGVEAVKTLIEGKSNVMIGTKCGQLELVPFEKAIKESKSINQKLYDLLTVLNV